MIDVSVAVKSAEELDKAVGIVAKLIGKLKAKPDLAAQKFGQALGEVAKTLKAVDNAASQFLSLGIDEGALAKSSKLLLDIDADSLRTKVERGRGHCHVIDEIFRKYLDQWFERVFHRDEYASVKVVFEELGSVDSGLFSLYGFRDCGPSVNLVRFALGGAAKTVATERATDGKRDVGTTNDESAGRHDLSAAPSLGPARDRQGKRPWIANQAAKSSQGIGRRPCGV